MDGLAASIASLIAISCDEIHIPSNAFIMIHNSWTVGVGNATELRATAEVLEKIDGTLAAQYTATAARILGAEAAEAVDFPAMMAREEWLTAEEAAAVGLCDVVLEAVQIAASVRPDIAALYANAPAELIASVDPAQENEAPVEVEPEAEIEEPEPEVQEEPDPAYVAEIRTLCALSEKPDLADGFIANQTSFEDARAAIWDKRVADDEAEIDNSQPIETKSEKPRNQMQELRKSQYARFSGNK